MKNSYIYKKCDKNVYFLLVLYRTVHIFKLKTAQGSAEELLSDLRWYFVRYRTVTDADT
jgi:hypothetical protein